MEDAQDAITDTEFSEVFERNIKSTNKIVDKDHPKDILPVLRVVLRSNFGGELNNVAVVLPDLPDTADGRREVFEQLGAKFMADSYKQGAPVAVVFTSEAWTKKIKKADYAEFEAAGKRVSDYADKQEIVLTVASTIDRRRAFATHDIKRDKKNHIEKIDLKLYAPYKGKGQAKQPFDAALLDSFYWGALSYLKRKETI